MRGPRMTKKQKIYLVNYLEQNKDLAHYNSGNNPNPEKELKWRELARGLNSTNLGPSKTTSQWKETFKDFRASIRKKSRTLQMRTNTDLKVSSAEIRFMKLMNLYTPPSQSSTPRYNISKIVEEADNNGFVKLENDEYNEDDHDIILSDDDPLVQHTERNNEINKSNSEQPPTKKYNMTSKDFIELQRNKIEERLHFNGNASLAVEIENHALQIQKLASSFDKHSDAINNLANSFNKVANAIDNVAEKLVTFFQR